MVAITAIGLRFIALLIFFYVLREISRAISLSTISGENQGWPIALVLIVLFLSFGIYIWKYSIPIATKIVPEELPVQAASNVDISKPLYQLVFVLLGLYVFIGSISSLLYAAQLYFTLPESLITSDFAKEQKAQIISLVFEICLALFLVFGAKGISNLMFRLRYAGDN